jgi:drug/metabolite transporter (DMT)-like permease
VPGQDASHIALAVGLAASAALAFAVATVTEQRAAAQSSDRDARGRKFLGQLLRNPRWLAAMGGNIVGYGLQAAALGVGSVVVVQPILVTSLVFALPLSAHLSHRRMAWTSISWGVLLAAALAVFVVLGDPRHGVDHASTGDWLVVTCVVTPLVVACLVISHPLSGAARASLLAVAVGLLGGVLAILTKAVVASAGQGVVHLLATSETYGLAVVGLAGAYVQQLAFQAGDLQASLPILTVLEPVVAVLLGLTVLREDLTARGGQLVLLLLSVGVMTVATLALARAQAVSVGRSAEVPTGRTR